MSRRVGHDSFNLSTIDFGPSRIGLVLNDINSRDSNIAPCLTHLSWRRTQVSLRRLHVVPAARKPSTRAICKFAIGATNLPNPHAAGDLVAHEVGLKLAISPRCPAQIKIILGFRQERLENPKLFRRWSDNDVKVIGCSGHSMNRTGQRAGQHVQHAGTARKPGSTAGRAQHTIRLR